MSDREETPKGCELPGELVPAFYGGTSRNDGLGDCTASGRGSGLKKKERKQGGVQRRMTSKASCDIQKSKPC